MARGDRLVAEYQMTFATNELRIFLPLIDFVVERTAIIGGRRDVTPFSARA